MKKPDSKMRDFENGTRNTEDENFDLHPAAAERRERTDHGNECRITVLETKVFPELQEKYLADPKSGPCH